MLLNTVCEKTKYGRLYAPDPRDMEFKLRASPVRAALVREERMWRTGAVLDQGPFPHCVGYAVYQFLISAPFMARKGRVLPGPVDIYNGAQDNDEWFGNNYEGTSGRGALKWLMKQGIVSNFRMAPDGPTMKNYILLESGLMVGTEWFMGMRMVRGPRGLNLPGRMKVDTKRSGAGFRRNATHTGFLTRGVRDTGKMAAYGSTVRSQSTSCSA
jgi:hypothetical protein